MAKTYYPSIWFVKFCLLALARFQVVGVEKVPKAGPLIVVSNHLSRADPPIISAGIPRRIVFMAKEELFHSPLMALIVKGFGAFPVRKQEADRHALRRAKEVLEKGLALGVFPEGTRSKTGVLQPGMLGAAFIALRTGAPVLPVGIYGTEGLKGAGFLRHPAITINIGEPFTVAPVQGRVTKQALQGITASMMDRIAQLLPPRYQGVRDQRVAVGR